MIKYQQQALAHDLKNRRILCSSVSDFNSKVVDSLSIPSRDDWSVQLGGALLFDKAGLLAIAKAIKHYSGTASKLKFRLSVSNEARRDYYSHNEFLENGCISLPVEAACNSRINDTKTDTLVITLPEIATDIPYPSSLSASDINRTPLALLMPYSCDHDVLFANQIAIFSNIAALVKRSPRSWLRALFSRHPKTLRKRIPLCWNRIHPDADVHPTATVEGSVVGSGSRIGAYCVVRYSVIGQQVYLHDGAKVEYSVVDDQSWLMHDLVLYRSLVETNVFLIHGPYQFSYFQHESAAFATIMMDYRPDAHSIRIGAPEGVKEYQGRFLGALLKERSKVLGGVLTAPGLTVPEGREISAKPEDIVRARDLIDAAERKHSKVSGSL